MASALLVDYILTVSVSVASGVDNIISALPQLAGMRVELALAIVVVLAAVNLRGVRESSKAFALPTYVFIASVALHGRRSPSSAPLLGQPPVAASSQLLRARRPGRRRPGWCCCCCARSRAAARR